MNTNFIWIMLALLSMNLIAVVYLLYVVSYNKAGLYFLRYAKGIVEKNDEPGEVKNLTNIFIPQYTHSLKAMSSVMRIIIITVYGNVMLFIYTALPDSESTFAWNIFAITAGLTNSFIIVSFKPLAQVKRDINATCESYSMLLKSFEYEKEYKDKDNGSPD